jgi:hypothetical protein
MKKVIYLASPYSHPDDNIRENNYRLVSKIAADMIANGDVVISPIAYGHPLLDFTEMPSDWKFWSDFCLAMLAKCDEMLVCKMPGWNKSRGVAEEIKYAKEHKIPVTYIEINPNQYDVIDSSGFLVINDSQKIKDILEEVYQKYSKSHLVPPINTNSKILTEQLISIIPQEYNREIFIQKLKTDHSFSRDYDLYYHIRELSYQERYQHWFSNNYETGAEYNENNTPDFDNIYYQPTPLRVLTIIYNNQKLKYYEFT